MTHNSGVVQLENGEVFHTRSKRNHLYSKAAQTMLMKRGFPGKPSLGLPCSSSIAPAFRLCNGTCIICAAFGLHAVLMRKTATNSYKTLAALSSIVCEAVVSCGVLLS